MSAGHALQVLG